MVNREVVHTKRPRPGLVSNRFWARQHDLSQLRRRTGKMGVTQCPLGFDKYVHYLYPLQIHYQFLGKAMHDYPGFQFGV